MTQEHKGTGAGFQQKAQTAVELAVFGAVLIFVIGLIVRGALNMGYMQNENLKAMRLAMKVSHQVSEDRDTASRNTTNILFVEDRLAAESGKYGPIKRVPYMVSASATHSRNLFLPVHTLDPLHLPVTDVFINGKHFVFTAAGFKTVELAKSCAGASPCPAECKGDCTAASECTLGDCAAACATSSLGCDPSSPPIDGSAQMYPGSAFAPTGPLDPAKDWDPNCATRTVTLSTCTPGGGPGSDYPADCPSICPDFANNCNFSSGPVLTTTEIIGCARVYTIQDNNPVISEWCAAACADNLSADERFDLDRDGTFGALDNEPDGPARQYFAWQWYEIKGFDGARNQGSCKGVSGLCIRRVTTLNGGGEGIIYEGTGCKEFCEKTKNIDVDVDGDWKLEKIVQNQIISTRDGIIKTVGVMDFQEGDMDFSIIGNDSATKPVPGLTNYARMRSEQMPGTYPDGTYLQIEEGRLFGAGAGQFIRTTQKKKQNDLIEREIQLSNDTGRYCSGGVPAACVDGATAYGTCLSTLVNPVEACGDCWGAANFNKTCMIEDSDLATPEKTPLIYVRSYIRDMRGRKWITDVTFDDYVDIQTPSVP